MAVEQLYGVAADAHALVRHQSPRQCRFTNETDPAFGTARGALCQQAHALKLDTDVGDRECHRMATADRLGEPQSLSPGEGWGGKGSDSTCRSGWGAYQTKKKTG